MPAPTTLEEFVELVRRSGLIDPQRLDNVLGQDDNETEATPRQGANRLVAAGLVTQFQAEQFLLGKWRGFTIGKYKVLERLGFGGNGTVYLCEHLVVKRRVALKVLPMAKATNPAALGRFYREARASGVLNHPNLVKAHDIDQENGLHFLVMEYVDGTSLQDLVARVGPLPAPRAAHYVKQAAQALQAAHEAGLVHRDVKPSNILVDRAGTVKVLDLGLARFFNDDNDLLTLKYDDNAVLGTADYVAPEQAMNSHGADIRADIYSLGCTFYFMLSGRPPFPGGKAAQKLIQHQTKMPQPVRERRSDVPAGLAAVLETMLAKDPARRQQTPNEVVEALAPWTEAPIPPPAESELPQLSPAARGEVPDAEPEELEPLPLDHSAIRSCATPNGLSRPSPTDSPLLQAVACKPVEAAEHETPRTLNEEMPTAVERKPRLAAVAEVAARLRPKPQLAARPVVKTKKRGLVRLTVILLASVVAGIAGRWAVSRWYAQQPAPQPPATLIVSASGEAGSYPSITAALHRARPGDVVVVRAETWEEAVYVPGEGGVGRNVRLEGRGPGDRPVLWRAPHGRGDGQPLLKVSGVSGFQVHGFTLDGQERLRELVVLTGPCPGLTLEDLRLTGFQQNGVALRNCLGEEGQPVVLQRLRIVPTHAAGSALYLDSRAEEMNRSIRVQDCRLEGPYEAAVVLSGRTADVELLRNRVCNAADGVVYRKATPAYPVDVRLVSNTFYRIANVGLHFEAAPAAQGSRVELTRNLFGRTGRLAHVDGFVPEPRQTSARWIWGPGAAGSGSRYFRLAFQVDGPSASRAVLDLVADAGFTAWLNGEPIGSGQLEPQHHVYAFDVARLVRPGVNVLAVQATGGRAAAGLLARLNYTCAGSDDRLLASDATWKVSNREEAGWQQPAFDQAQWSNAVVVAPYGLGAAGWRSLVWDKVVRDTFGGDQAEQLFPEPVDNYRDAESAESFPPLQATPLRFTLPTNAAHEATFLRYPADSELAKAARAPGVPPVATPAGLSGR